MRDSFYHIEDREIILITLYCFVDEFITTMQKDIQFALKRPGKGNVPAKTFNLSIAELITLAMFRFFLGYRNWKDYHKHLRTYHHQDFPHLPEYDSFRRSMNLLSPFAVLLLQSFCTFFNQSSPTSIKLADSTKLEVCQIKREFTYKVCKRIARKSKNTTGWFYGFKLHVICNQWMEILDWRITAGNVDDRDGLMLMWEHIIGLIVADGGYVGKELQRNAYKLGKHLLTGVRNNMKKLMTESQHHLLKLRQLVETVFSVLKHRMGLQNTLPRSELGHFAHYVWCLAAYQLRKYFDFVSMKPLLS